MTIYIVLSSRTFRTEVLTTFQSCAKAPSGHQNGILRFRISKAGVELTRSTIVAIRYGDHKSTRQPRRSCQYGNSLSPLLSGQNLG
jgi:hypothetical protein